MSWRWCAAVALGVLAASLARGDERDLYTLVGYEAGVGRFTLPATADGEVTGYAGAVDLTTYYGFTDALHIGGRLRVTAGSDLQFDDRTVTTSDGSQVTGNVFMDHRALSVGGLVVYRVDKGWSLVPVFEVGAGVSAHQYRNIAVYQSGGSAGTGLPAQSETRFYGAVAALLEHRFRDRWVASVGVGLEGEPGGLVPWTVVVPIRVGLIW